MPHLTITGCDMERNIQQMNIHVELQYKRGYYATQRQQQKQKELLKQLEDLVQQYFDEVDSDELTNHEWNTRISNY